MKYSTKKENVAVWNRIYPGNVSIPSDHLRVKIHVYGIHNKPKSSSCSYAGSSACTYKGWLIRKVARYTGFSHGAIINWIRKAPNDGRHTIPTLSSRPQSNPLALSQKTVEAIVEQRKQHRRCGKIIHQELKQKGVDVSLSSVNRTLKRCWLLRERSPWKRWHSAQAQPN